jgi:hypothetical protein
MAIAHCLRLSVNLDFDRPTEAFAMMRSHLGLHCLELERGSTSPHYQVPQTPLAHVAPQSERPTKVSSESKAPPDPTAIQVEQPAQCEPGAAIAANLCHAAPVLGRRSRAMPPPFVARIELLEMAAQWHA